MTLPVAPAQITHNMIIAEFGVHTTNSEWSLSGDGAAYINFAVGSIIKESDFYGKSGFAGDWWIHYGTDKSGLSGSAFAVAPDITGTSADAFTTPLDLTTMTGGAWNGQFSSYGIVGASGFGVPIKDGNSGRLYYKSRGNSFYAVTGKGNGVRDATNATGNGELRLLYSNEPRLGFEDITSRLPTTWNWSKVADFLCYFSENGNGDVMMTAGGLTNGNANALDAHCFVTADDGASWSHGVIPAPGNNMGIKGYLSTGDINSSRFIIGCLNGSQAVDGPNAARWLKSDDLGASWSTLNTGDGDARAFLSVGATPPYLRGNIKIDFDPSYTGFSGAEPVWRRSTNGGVSHGAYVVGTNPTTNTVKLPSGTPDEFPVAWATDYNGTIVVISSTSDMWTTTNEGVSWTAIGNGWMGMAFGMAFSDYTPGYISYEESAGLFVSIMGANGIIAYSADGLNWSMAGRTSSNGTNTHYGDKANWIAYLG